MKIEFIRSGGFAGLRRRFELDSDRLPEAERVALETLIDRARFFELPGELRSPHPDAFQYDLSIEKEGRRHAVRLDDRGAPEALKPLLARLTELSRETRP